MADLMIALASETSASLAKQVKVHHAFQLMLAGLAGLEGDQALAVLCQSSAPTLGREGTWHTPC